MGPVFTIFSLIKRLPITAGRTHNSRRRTREDARDDGGFYGMYATLFEPIYGGKNIPPPPQLRSSMDFFLRRSAYRELMTGRGDASIERRRSKSWPTD